MSGVGQTVVQGEGGSATSTTPTATKKPARWILMCAPGAKGTARIDVQAMIPCYWIDWTAKKAHAIEFALYPQVTYKRDTEQTILTYWTNIGTPNASGTTTSEDDKFMLADIPGYDSRHWTTGRVNDHKQESLTGAFIQAEGQVHYLQGSVSTSFVPNVDYFYFGPNTNTDEMACSPTSFVQKTEDSGSRVKMAIFNDHSLQQIILDDGQLYYIFPAVVTKTIPPVTFRDYTNDKIAVADEIIAGTDAWDFVFDLPAPTATNPAQTSSTITVSPKKPSQGINTNIRPILLFQKPRVICHTKRAVFTPIVPELRIDHEVRDNDPCNTSTHITSQDGRHEGDLDDILKIEKFRRYDNIATTTPTNDVPTPSSQGAAAPPAPPQGYATGTAADTSSADGSDDSAATFDSKTWRAMIYMSEIEGATGHLDKTPRGGFIVDDRENIQDGIPRTGLLRDVFMLSADQYLEIDGSAHINHISTDADSERITDATKRWRKGPDRKKLRNDEKGCIDPETVPGKKRDDRNSGPLHYRPDADIEGSHPYIKGWMYWDPMLAWSAQGRELYNGIGRWRPVIPTPRVPVYPPTDDDPKQPPVDRTTDGPGTGTGGGEDNGHGTIINMPTLPGFSNDSSSWANAGGGWYATTDGLGDRLSSMPTSEATMFPEILQDTIANVSVISTDTASAVGYVYAPTSQEISNDIILQTSRDSVREGNLS